MCEPTTIGLIAATVLTTAYQADVQRKEGKANAEIAENNARLAQADADASNAQATRESEQQAWRTRAMVGQQRAAIAANNVDPTLGTASELMGETAMFGEVDQQTIRANAARQAWGFNAQATNYGNQATLSRWGGSAKANGTILGGLTSAASMGYGGMKAGGASAAKVGARTSGTISNGSWMGGYA